MACFSFPILSVRAQSRSGSGLSILEWPAREGRGDIIQHDLECPSRPMTDEQRGEITKLCREADILDKSGELLTRQGAHDRIDDLREKARNLKNSSSA